MGYYHGPTYMADQSGDLTFQVPLKTLIAIDSWVHIFIADVVFGLFSRGARYEKRVNEDLAFKLGLLSAALYEGRQLLECSAVVKVGKNCVIDPHAVIHGPTTIGDNVTINAGAPSTLIFTLQPGSASAGAAIPGPPSVAVQDSFGNTVTDSTAAITISIGTNPSGGILSGTTTRNAVAGVASFSDVSIDRGGNGYTLAVYWSRPTVREITHSRRLPAEHAGDPNRRLLSLLDRGQGSSTVGPSFA